MVFAEGTVTGPTGKQATVIHFSGMTAEGFPDGSRTAQRLGVLVLAAMMLVLTFPGPAWADKFGKARKKLNEALKHYEQGSALYSQGKCEAAIVEYRAALHEDPDEPYWHEALGVAIEKQGDLQTALEEYRLAGQLSPYDSGLHSKYDGLRERLISGAASEPVKAAVPAQDVYPLGGRVSAPYPHFKPQPPYSEKARIAKYSGTVVLRLVVNEGGSVSDVAVVKPLFFGLAEQAIQTVRTWKFGPALRDGTPVPVRVIVEVNFRLY